MVPLAGFMTRFQTLALLKMKNAFDQKAMLTIFFLSNNQLYPITGFQEVAQKCGFSSM